MKLCSKQCFLETMMNDRLSRNEGGINQVGHLASSWVYRMHKQINVSRLEAVIPTTAPWGCQEPIFGANRHRGDFEPSQTMALTVTGRFGTGCLSSSMRGPCYVVARETHHSITAH